MNSIELKGVIPILATPFDDNERLDLDSLHHMIQFMTGIGVNGITVLGVLGESNRLTDQERESVIKTAVAAAKNRIPVVVGASHAGTHATTQLTAMAADCGAQAVMIAPSAEAVPNDDRVFEYFQRIGLASPVPVVVQDHPASTSVHMPASLMLKIVSEIPTICAIKEEAVPTPPKLRTLVSGMKTRRVPVLTGLGALYGLFDLEAGSDGFNTGFAFPEVLLAMVAAARAANWARVKTLYEKYLPLIVFEQQPGVGIRKEILRRRGLIKTAKVRHPGSPMPAGAAEQLDELLANTIGADLSKPLAH